VLFMQTGNFKLVGLLLYCARALFVGACRRTGAWDYCKSANHFPDSIGLEARDQ
jgi:hypothetical protein